MKNIFLIDDDSDIRGILTYILEEEGYHLTASSSPIILKESQLTPDLIILDERLKGAKGSEICKEYKGNPATSHIPVLLISAINSIDLIAANCHADGYIAKPFDLEEMLAIIKSTISNNSIGSNQLAEF